MRLLLATFAVLWLISGGVTHAEHIGTSSVVLVDKNVLQELVAEAQREGMLLNIAVYEYDETREVWDRARPNHCLISMETAMRAMERFVPRHWVDMDLPMNGGVRYELLHSELPSFRDAVAQWAKAKTCWRNP